MEKRLTLFLEWTHYKVYETKLNLNEKPLLSWFKDVVRFYSEYLSQYAIYLENVMELRSSTINNYLFDIVAAAKWFAYLKAIRDEDGNAIEINLRPFEYVLKLVSKQHRKQRKREMNQNDLAELVACRRLPENGIQPLIECVLDDCLLNHEMFSNKFRDVTPFVNKDFYEKYISLMYASLYVFSAQGRVGGIQSLKYEQADDLLHNGFVMSKNFKSKSSWMYQPVTISPLSKRLVHFYITRVRPKVTQESGTQGALWLDWNGNPETDIGAIVTRYFRRKLELHITTTAIRSLVETNAQEFFERGDITLGERESISHINGCSLNTECSLDSPECIDARKRKYE
jgi:hypothetical protein